jgi:hypothetical protein
VPLSSLKNAIIFPKYDETVSNLPEPGEGIL